MSDSVHPSLSCAIEGPEGAPAVVFIHGLAASSKIWRGQAERLSDAYRTVRVDLRSHGASPAVPDPVTRSELANDVARALAANGIERATIVGHSAGGVVAMQTAVDHPELVSRLVLVGTASECNDKTAAWYASTADAAEAKGGESGMKAMGMKPGSGPTPDGAGLAALCRAMRTLNAEPLTDAIGRFAGPALVIVGEKDFLGVGGSVILSRAIEDSRLEIVPKRGHGIYLEDPDWFAGRVRAFLEETSG